MKCQKCGFDNAKNASFCGKCGAPLSITEIRNGKKGKMVLPIVALVITLLGWIYFGVATVVGYFSPEETEIPFLLGFVFLPHILTLIAFMLSVFVLVQKEMKNAGKVIAVVALILSVIMLSPVLSLIFTWIKLA